MRTCASEDVHVQEVLENLVELGIEEYTTTPCKKIGCFKRILKWIKRRV